MAEIIVRALGLASILGLAAGCGQEGVDRASGLEGSLSAVPGQWLPGGPTVNSTGPSVLTLNTVNNMVYPGERNKAVSGTLGPGAVAVGFRLAGDPGYWVLPAGPPDFQAPADMTFEGKLSLSALTPPGARDLELWAIDASGVAGPVRAQTFLVSELVPQGALVVSLTWDTLADLDLRVVQPGGNEIGSKTASLLDFDSNAGCSIDGRDMENAVWAAAPSSGTHTVRVDTFSLCGEAAARWQVRVLRDGVEIGRAQGQSLPTDTAFSHGPGAGVLALQFQIP